jgi:acid phosphatase
MRRTIAFGAMLGGLLALSGCTTPTPAPSPVPVTKVLTILEENHTLAQAQAGMPYLVSQAKEYGYATGYRAVAHPSLPNYLAITGGSTFGVLDDSGPSVHPEPSPSVFGQVLAAGKSAKVYAEGQPSNCYTGNTATYAVRHTAWPYYPGERAQCQANQVNLDALPGAISTGLPNASLVVPGLCNDGHDCSLSTADTWLRTWLPRIKAGSDFTSGRLAIVVTFDEGVGSDQNILTVVLHQGMHGMVVSTPLTHYSLTGLIDDAAHVPALRNAATAPSMKNAFGLTT